MSDDTQQQPDGTPAGEQGKEQTFTQSDVDRIVRERVQRERAKYADYDDLKAKAGEKATAEERIAALEANLRTATREAMKRSVQARHGIADEDADLFLTGEDEDTLTLQAKRLADRDSERKKRNNVVPQEGSNPKPAASDEREFTRQLFARAQAD
jgi:hypothetical protein